LIADSRPFFFLHVMKTGGKSFRQHIKANFAPEEQYPPPEKATVPDSYMLIDELRAFPAERHRAVRAYAGHFPFVATTLVGREVITMTLLRDPVERTVSFLRHCKRLEERHHDHSLEEIYEDPWMFHLLIHNHQLKLFALTADDRLESHMDLVDFDDPARIRTAYANLEQVDVLGLTERYPDFLDQMERRFGWQFAARPDRGVSREGWDVPAAFRRRIAEDNALDIEFYERASAISEEQRRRPSRISRTARRLSRRRPA
jgi:hypothetical protein